MLYDLLQVASNLGCNMESLLSELQQQHQQAQQLPRQRDQAPNPVQARAGLTTPASLTERGRPGRRSQSRKQSRRSQPPTIRPLDLSTATRRESGELQAGEEEASTGAPVRGAPPPPPAPPLPLPLNLVKSDVESTTTPNEPAASPIRLITSSTSPFSSPTSSTLSSTLTLSSHVEAATDLDCNNNDSGQQQQQAIDVISSTNSRPVKRRRVKRQSSSSSSSGLTRTHLCNQCGRSFSRSDMLTRHSRLHSGLKPYQCGKCLQVFSRSDHLSTHERTHTGEKPYQCRHCSYSACRRDMITRHMRTHSGVLSDSDTALKSKLKGGERRRRSSSHAGDLAGEMVILPHIR